MHMLSIIISHKNQQHLSRCLESLKKTLSSQYETIVVSNAEGKRGLAEVYNEAAKDAQHDFLVFVHEDVTFKTLDWGKKLVDLLKNKQIGAVGVAGTTYLPVSGIWTEPKVPFLRGRIVYPMDHGTYKEKVDLFCVERGDFDVVALDGVFITTRKDIVHEIPFDQKHFDGFHFYDVDFSFRVAQKYRVIVTTDILLKHYSGGSFDKAWDHYRKIFVEKHREVLPFTNQDIEPDWNNNKGWPVKFIR